MTPLPTPPWRRDTEATAQLNAWVQTLEDAVTEIRLTLENVKKSMEEPRDDTTDGR